MEQMDLRQRHKLSLNARNLREVFVGYVNVGLFTDCSLVSSCGKSLQVHKAVISASSEFLAKLLLMRNSDAHPVLVFPEIDYVDMRRLVELIYKSELLIDEDDLDGLMFAAEKLRINGMTPTTPKTLSPTSSQSSSSKSSENQSNSTSSDSSRGDIDNDEMIPQPIRKKPKLQEPLVDKKVPSKVTKPSVTCNFCEKKLKNAKSRNEHQRVCHQNPKRVVFKCEKCPMTYTRNHRLTNHRKTHEKVNQPNPEAKVDATQTLSNKKNSKNLT